MSGSRKKNQVLETFDGEEVMTFEDDDAGGTRTCTVSVQEMPRMSRAARRAQVRTFVEHTLKTGVAGLIAEFKSMKRTNDFNVMREFVAQIPQGRNRYKDVGCLDFQRVVLRLGPVSYIHANYVSTPMSPKRFICTQNSKKAAEYVPLSYENKTMNFNGITVTLKKQEQVGAQCYPNRSSGLKESMSLSILSF
ncbi:hypothetical protein ANCDUO_08187 [Ancylostoma duodenale]|uniref:Tyrosine-protein phosphatase domain-containing protein n=1 Tax=Ancylostoma duodenale TaxID=51022 RepID=A0A0C2DGG2_9BILA|nr:hypothetical protein ANCDUO_08187 [Ancylostoma duodenale]